MGFAVLTPMHATISIYDRYLSCLIWCSVSGCTYSFWSLGGGFACELSLIRNFCLNEQIEIDRAVSDINYFNGTILSQSFIAISIWLCIDGPCKYQYYNNKAHYTSYPSFSAISVKT